MARQRSLSESNRDALLLELNRLIEEVAEQSARSVVHGRLTDTTLEGIVYPPNSGFTTEEVAALRLLREVPGVEAALRKVVASAAASALFHCLTLIDGLCDPDCPGWSGVSLLDREDEDEEDVSLHLYLHELYWKWREVRGDKGWRLDTYEG